jgi:hypothetical protein
VSGAQPGRTGMTDAERVFFVLTALAQRHEREDGDDHAVADRVSAIEDARDDLASRGLASPGPDGDLWGVS